MQGRELGRSGLNKRARSGHHELGRAEYRSGGARADGRGAGCRHRSSAGRVVVREGPDICCNHPDWRYLRSAIAAQHRQPGSQPVARSPGWYPIDLSALWNDSTMRGGGLLLQPTHWVSLGVIEHSSTSHAGEAGPAPIGVGESVMLASPKLFTNYLSWEHVQ